MSDQVLTDEQRRAAYGLHDDEPNGLSDRLARVERAVVAALAARGGVDVEELAAKATVTTSMYGNATLEYGDRAKVADAIRLALATAEARHAHATPTNREIAAECRALDLQRQLDEANGLARVVEARHAERERITAPFIEVLTESVRLNDEAHLGPDHANINVKFTAGALRGLRRALGLEP